MEYIMARAIEYRDRGTDVTVATVKIFAELKVVRYGDVRLLVDQVYLES